MNTAANAESSPGGGLFIIAAPSGTGKSTISAHIRDMGLAKLSVSYTTRPPRPQEKDGEQYFFVSLAQFINMRDAGEFLEWAEVFGHFYGTGVEWVRDMRRTDVNVLLEIDWQGARQVRELSPDAVSIFICPPSLETLQSRLVSRRQDTPAVISRRMAQAESDMTHRNEFDYVIINDDLNQAVRQVSDIFRMAGCKTKR